ncbi:MAG TPA: response regulator transcription factor [Chitinophagaceae bacterium]|jgi:DNA-binding NarL/FixJ family response regulator
MEQKKIKIIIADGHETIRHTWKLLLQADFHFSIIAECSNEAELMDALAHVDADIILIDTDIHPANGFEATKKIHKAYPLVKVIGISIHDQPMHVRHMFKVGAKGFVTKDSSKAEMIKAILAVYNGGKFIGENIKGKMKHPGDNEFFQ